jgi:hypothetical protein
VLPDPLPTDPDELEAIYREFIAQDNMDQAEFDRLTEARLRSWGYDPQHVTPEQLLRLMQESMNSLMVNLYGAAQSAPDETSQAQIQEIIERAEQLRDQIQEAFHEDKPPPDPKLPDAA